MLKRIFSATGVCLALTASALYGQTPAAAPAFEVASIKPVDMPGPAAAASGKIHAGMKIDASRVDIGLFSLTDLICKAYDVKKYQVSGPDWLNGQRFDVIAKMPEGATKEQVPQMLQALLAERFKLVIHHDKKEQSVYALVVGKGGSKMKEADPLPTATPAPTEAGGPAPPASTGSSEVTFKASAGGAVVNDGKGGQQKVSMGADGKIHIENSRANMTEFAEGMSGFVDRPVVDMTELKGFYQVTLELSMQDMMNAARKAGVNMPAPPSSGGTGGDAARPADAAGDSTPSSIFASLQGLGLKLEPRKLPVDLIVVDKVEKMPTDN